MLASNLLAEILANIIPDAALHSELSSQNSMTLLQGDQHYLSFQVTDNTILANVKILKFSAAYK